MIKVILVEDEILGQKLLSKYLTESFHDVSIVSICDNVKHAVSEIKAKQPELVFLDIQLKGGTAFDVLEKFNNRNFEIIFITAYDNFTLRALNEHAFDYLIKPINKNHLINSTKHCITKLKSQQIPDGKNPETLFVKTYKGIELIKTADILYFEGFGAYTKIYYLNKHVVSSKHIGKYMQVLDDKMFFRAHNSYIVNLKKIKRVDMGRSGVIILHSDHKIALSQRRIRDFIKLWSLQ